MKIRCNIAQKFLTELSRVAKILQRKISFDTWDFVSTTAVQCSEIDWIKKICLNNSTVTTWTYTRLQLENVSRLRDSATFYMSSDHRFFTAHSKIKVEKQLYTRIVMDGKLSQSRWLEAFTRNSFQLKCHFTALLCRFCTSEQKWNCLFLFTPIALLLFLSFPSHRPIAFNLSISSSFNDSRPLALSC